MENTVSSFFIVQMLFLIKNACAFCASVRIGKADSHIRINNNMKGYNMNK